jgi:hypothetical protein
LVGLFDGFVVLPVWPPVAAGPPVSPTALPVVTVRPPLPAPAAFVLAPASPDVVPALASASFFRALAADFSFGFVVADTSAAEVRGSFAGLLFSPAANAEAANRPATSAKISFFIQEPFHDWIEKKGSAYHLEPVRQFLFNQVTLSAQVREIGEGCAVYQDAFMRLEMMMTSERFARYRFEMSGLRLTDSGKWVPWLEIKICADDPADGEIIFPKQRIAEDDVFESEDAAVDEARRFAIAHVSSGEF